MGNYYIFLGSQADRHHLKKFDLVGWTAHKNFTLNDTAFFYITAPVSAIVACGVMLEKLWVDDDPNSKWKGKVFAEIYIQSDSLHIPIRHLRQLFPEWAWLRYPRQNALIPQEIVKPFLELVGEKNK